MKGWICLGGLIAVLCLAAPASAQPAREHMPIVAGLGGEYLGPQADYVQRVGDRMAQAAGIRGRCVFTVLNSDIVNAFTAPPGCYVYVTRGLLALMSSEAELAAVLGHELGHVSASHAQRQEQAEQLSSLAAALIGAATKSDLAGGVAKRVGKLGMLGYSRSQEYEADQLALRYLPLAGYSPDGLTGVLEDLSREDAFTARVTGRPEGGDVPAWARTHPLTGDRIQRVRTQVAGLSVAEGLATNEAQYLDAMQGLPVGADPAQGYVAGNAFVHPLLGIRFEAPRGFAITNENDAVRLSGPAGALAQFQAARAGAAELVPYGRGVLMQIIGRGRFEMGQSERTTINGLPAAVVRARAWSGGRPVDLTCVAYATGEGQVFHFVTMAPAGQAAMFEPLYASFRRLTAREREGGGRRLAVTTVRSGDTVQSLAALMAPDVDNVARFRMLNGLREGEDPAPGTQVKIVVQGRR